MTFQEKWDQFCDSIGDALPPSAAGALAAVLGVGFGALTVWGVLHTTDIKFIIGSASMSLAMFIWFYKQ